MKKNWLLVIVAIALTAVYAIYFTDWFRPKTIQIFHTYRNLHPRMPVRDGTMPALHFGWGRPLKLTEIRLVPLAEYQTNQNTLPLWHLISDSNSVPIESFFYGQFIRGLKPEVAGSRSRSLTNGVVYRVIVTAGKIKGEHDFELK